MRITLLAFVFGFAISVVAQETSFLDNNQLSDALARLENSSLRTREIAFQDLIRIATESGGQTDRSSLANPIARFLASHPEQADRVKLALIRLLTIENNTFLGENVPPGSYTETDTEHFATVVDVVSSLDDERALPALVGALQTGGMAAGGVVKYGDKGLSLVLNALHSTKPLQRAAALGTAVTILKDSPNPSASTQIASLIQSSLQDSNATMRTQAVMLVECFGNRRDFVPILEQIAKTDPLRFPGKADDGVDSDGFYPVRFQARRVLRAISSNSVCRP